VINTACSETNLGLAAAAARKRPERKVHSLWERHFPLSLLQFYFLKIPLFLYYILCDIIYYIILDVIYLIYFICKL
jgi:hypothetical protein